MAILTVDTGILLSAVSVVVSIVLFMYKTLATKGEKSIVYSQTVKQNTADIANLKDSVEKLREDVNKHNGNIIGFGRDIEFLKERVKELKQDIGNMEYDLDNRKKPVR